MLAGEFEEQVNRTPDHIAVKAREHWLTYRELNSYADRIAHRLEALNRETGHNTVFGLLFEHGIDMIAGLMAVLKTGNAYVPLPLEYPVNRLEYMVTHSGCELILTNSRCGTTALQLAGKSGIPLLDIDNIPRAVPWHRRQEVKGNLLAYIIYTSGTTGSPRGVVQTLENVWYHIKPWSQRFHITPGDRLTLFSSFGHDASVMDIYGALLNGAALYPLDMKNQDETLELSEFLEKEKITVWHSVPTLFNYFAGTLTGREKFKHLRYIILGGEAIRQHEIDMFKRHFPYSELAGIYGQTESSVNAVWMVRPQDTVNKFILGETQEKTRIFIVDPEGNEVGALRSGEILIASPYVSPGYWRDKAGTAASFAVDDEFGRLYWTGDIGRLLLDGNIQFIGRKDHQVKIRGHRVEPGEIETRLLHYPGICEAAVAPREDQQGNKYLAAYYVMNRQGKNPAPAPTALQLREYLAQYLPDYMIPAFFVPQERFPLTRSGKIDRRALPEPMIQTAQKYTAPRDKIEKTMAKIWAEVLAIPAETIGLEDHFFELGGHSLKAAALVSLLHQALDIDISLSRIFQAPTLKQLSQYIKEAKREKYFEIPQAETREYYPMSSAQKRLYLLQQMDPGSTAYNMSFAFPLGKEAKKHKIEAVLKRLIARHESLRTSFINIDDLPVQRVHEAAALEFEMENQEVEDKVNAIAGHSPKSQELRAKGFINSFIRPFDLSRAPLIRSGLIKMAGNQNTWLVDLHHIICDGTSHAILIEDFTTLYKQGALMPLAIQYKDFSQWQNRLYKRGKIKEQQQYWGELYRGEIPRIEMPTDNKRPGVFTFTGDSYRFALDREEAAQFKTLGAAAGGTLYMNILAALNTLLYKYTGQTDIIIGSGTSGRNHAELQRVVGMFINTLMMRNYPHPEKTYETFLKEVINNSIKAFENQDVQFEDLVERLQPERNTSRNPIFDITLVVQNFQQPGKNKPKNENYGQIKIIPKVDETLSPLKLKHLTARFDMTFFIQETDGGIRITIEYYTAIFKKDTIKRLASHLKNIICKVNKNPAIKLKDIEMISQQEKYRVLYEFNDTAAKEYPKNKSIHWLIREQVEQTPDNISLVGSSPVKNRTHLTYISYRELNEKTDQIAHFLIEKGVAADTIVSIMLARSLDMVIGMLGILKAGGAYLPIDPEYPAERIKYMLKDSVAEILLKENDFMPEAFNNCPKGTSSYLHLPPAPATSLAYVIYTSGSTGRPKGVLVRHQAFVNLIYAHREIFGENPDSRISQVANPGFDAMAFEIWPCLSSGAALYIADKETCLDPGTMKQWLIEKQITISFQSTLMAERLLEETWPESGAALNALRTAGDRLTCYPTHQYPFTLYNLYGPTEDTVWTTYTEVKPAADGERFPGIGKPINNHRVYIVDRYFRLQPIGIPGELCIDGEGLAVGYLNRPGLTAEKFCPITPLPRSSVYRTGDLAKWLPDGNIVFIGRIDRQVKIRGYRIELGEIENRLLSHKNIKEVVVTAREKNDNDKYLCAYIVPHRRDESWETGLKEHLAAELPYYMVPTYFIHLEKIPLNPNGKVDRKALPEPGMTKKKIHIPPTNPIEKKLAVIWSEVLKWQGTIGIDDNFFELGGHSLTATTMASKVFKEFNVKIPLVEIFNTPFIRNLARHINRETGESYAAIDHAEEKEFYPLSSSQKRLYILHQMESAHVGYNLSQIIHLEQNIDIKKLELAFKELIHRHESLRTSFHMKGDEPVQKIHDQVEFKIRCFDFKRAQVVVKDGDEEGTRGLAPLPIEPAAQNPQLATALISYFIRPFDLSQTPLLRVMIIESQSPGVKLFIDMHHIITDAASKNILKQELLSLYAGETLPAPRLHYKDYAQWQNSRKHQDSITAQQNYWATVFPDELPVLNLPFDFHRPPKKSFEGNTISFILATTQTIRLKHLLKEAKITPFMLVMAGFNVLLSKLSGQEDIIIGIPVMGRGHADLEQIMGMFVNTLAMRSYPVGAKTFTEFLQEIKESTLAAFENQDYQFDELVKQLTSHRDHDRNPIFDVMFNLLNQQDYTDTTLEIDKQRLHQHQKGVSKFDLTLTAVDLGKNLLCSIEYSTKLFKSRTIDRIIEYFKKIFDSIFENPGQKLLEIGIITELEKNRILYKFNDTRTDYPEDKTIHECFEQQAARMPNHIIMIEITPGVHLSGLQQQLSYRELNQRANQLSDLLREKGVKPDTIIGIMMERSLEMIIGILGILKAGGAYLPIEPDYPEERKQCLLVDSCVKVLVSKVREIRGESIEYVVNKGSRLRDLRKVSMIYERLQLILVDKAMEYFTGKAPQHPEETTTPSTHHFGQIKHTTLTHLTHLTHPGQLCYVLYTSGSTGKPKGVMVNHRSVLRLVINTNFITFDPRDRLLKTGALDFDASTFEIWGPLLNGALLCLASRDELLNPDRLKTLIREKNITIIWMTAPLFNHMLKEDIEIFKGLKSLLVGGDVLSPPHIRQIKKKYPQLNVINGYGPTENTTFSTTHPVQLPITGTIPIGKPIANSTAYILDKYNHLLPVGVPGELVVGGDGVARGYLNNPELTAEKFINLSSLFEGTRGLAPLLYRTGDLARWLSDGSIEFLGRQDFQVKIRGFRIEPGEIENHLLNHPQVKEAVVIARHQQGKETDEKYLCAYIVPDRVQKPKAQDLHDYLAALLPDFMVPAHFVLLEKIPLNANGKLRRNALPEPEFTSSQSYAAPTNPVEQQLTEIWSDVLGVRGSIGIYDNFFVLGGHSLKGTILAAKIHQAFQVKIPLKEIFAAPTIKELASHIGRTNKNTYRDIEKLKENDFYEPSYNQKRLWILHQLSPQSPAYHLPGNLVLNHEVDEQAIKKTVNEIVQRHESFRTGFKLLNDQPMQFILSEIEPPLEMIDISIMKEKEKQQETNRIYTEIAITPFQLHQPPLFRSVLVKLGSRHYEFMFNVHHIISDGWSMEILKRDFYEIYEANRKRKPVKLPPLTIQYKEFAAMHNNQLKDPVFKKEAQEFWKKKLPGAIPALKFHGSLDKNTDDKTGAGYHWFIQEQLKEKLQKTANENNTSLFMVMFSVYILFLVRFTGQQDIACSFISAGREHVNLHHMIGFFVNSVIFRTRVDEQENFEAFLRRINKDILEIFAYQSYPLELVFEELQVKYPDISVSFNMINIRDATRNRELPSIRPSHVEKLQDVKFDLEPYINKYKNGIHIYWAYRKNLFTPKIIEYMTSEYTKLLDYFTSHLNSNYQTYRDRLSKPTFKRRG